MSIELSNDQLQAVDAEGTPLKVIDPRSGNIYVLVPDSVFGDRQSPQIRDRAQETSSQHWTDEKNRRRCELIDKEIADAITETEATELAALQREMLEFRRKVAPLPLADLRNLHHELLNRAASGS